MKIVSPTAKKKVQFVKERLDFVSRLIHRKCLAEQEAVRKAQEELAKQKEVIVAQDKELKVQKNNI